MKHTAGFLNTPPLWKKEQFGLQQFKLPSIDVDSIAQFDVPTNLRLGHQVEHIFLQLLKQHPDYNVLDYNIQIKKEKNTIGELDFLVRFRESVYHIELSYKFYLIDSDITEPIHRLIGPNRKDMFWTKLEKTKNKQLPLLYTTECKPHLDNLRLKAEDIIQHVCFLGQLFVPIHRELSSIRPINKACISGYWLKMNDFETIPFRESEYYIPYKSEWIHTPHKDVQWLSHYDTLLEVNLRHINKNAPMLWRRKPDESIDKLFVVWW